MRHRILALIVVWGWLILTGLAYAAPSLAVNPPQGAQGTVFTVTGTGFTPGETVTFQVFLPDGSTHDPAPGIANLDGEAMFYWISRADEPTGVYRVSAGGNASGTPPDVQFSVTPALSPTLTIFPPSADSGRTLQLIGAGFQPGEVVDLRITRPDGLLWPVTEIADSYGGFVDQVPTVGQPAGNYQVEATGSQLSRAATAFTLTVEPGCTQSILNESFETGALTPWVASSSGGFPLVTADAPHIGHFSAFLGGYNNAHDQIWQAVTIPPDADSTWLGYWWRLDTDETAHPHDQLSVTLLDSAGEPLEVLEVLDNVDPAHAWLLSQFDLSRYAGQAVRLSFAAITDATNPTGFYIDDVSLAVCVPLNPRATATATGSPTASPTLTSTPTASPTTTPTATQSPTPTLTPTATREPGHGDLAGRVWLQARTDHSDALISLDGMPLTLTGTDGQYCLHNLDPGQHLVHIERSAYLCTEADVRVSADQATNLADAVLRGGDANGDQQISLFDLVIVGTSYGSSPPSDPRADLNGDDRVDIFDLVMLGGNYGLHCPTPWLPPGLAQVAGMTTDGRRPAAGVEVAVVGRRSLVGPATIEVWAKGMTGLFGAEVWLRFDSSRLRAVGIPWQSGLITAPTEGYTADNTVNNATGQAILAVTRLAPARPLSGDVLLGRLEFQRIASGPATVWLDGMTLVDQEGRALPAEVHISEVDLGEGRVFLPIIIGRQ
jgi:hypothetical protein